MSTGAIPFENRHIPGLSLKSLVWLIACTVSIMLFVWKSTAGIEAGVAQIDRRMYQMELQAKENERYLDLRIKTIELNVSAIQLELRELRERAERIK